MKKWISVFILTMIFSYQGISGDHSRNIEDLEELAVKKITMVGNFMPPSPANAPLSTLIVAVLSNGCTQVQDFDVEVHQNDKYQEVTLFRNKEDRCKRRPFEIDLEIITSDLWLNKKVSIKNPVLVIDNTIH